MSKSSRKRVLSSEIVAGEAAPVRQVERLVRLEGKLDLLLEERADQETRLRKLERLSWLAVGAAVLASVLGSEVVSRLITG